MELSVKKFLLYLYATFQCLVFFILSLINIFFINYNEFKLENFLLEYIWGIYLIIIFIAIYSTIKLIINKNLNIYQKICSILAIQVYIHILVLYTDIVKYGI